MEIDGRNETVNDSQKIESQESPLDLPKGIIAWLKKKAAELGFHIYTDEMQKSDRALIGLIRPNLKRINETEKQLSFRKEFNGMKIVIYTSIIESECKYSESGRVWAHLTEPHLTKGSDTVYSTYFMRGKGDTLDKLVLEMEFLSHQLEKRPVGKDGKKMMLIEEPRTHFYWVSQSDDRERKSFYDSELLKGLRKEVKEFALLQLDRKQTYEISRPKRGIVNRARDKRKTAKVLSGSKAIDKIRGGEEKK
jgi:hypothetical protein